MPITRLNHAVLYVRDVARSVAFYTEALGFRLLPMTPGGLAGAPFPGAPFPGAAFPGAAFLQAAGSTNDHDIGLFEIGPGAGRSPAGRSTVGLYHLAWEVDTLAELERLAGELRARGALVGASDHGTTKSLYGRDPDGLEFEVVWIVPADELDADTLDARRRIGPLDIRREQERYGATTAGGI